jgi:hypothetical protein
MPRQKKKSKPAKRIIRANAKNTQSKTRLAAPRELRAPDKLPNHERRYLPIGIRLHRHPERLKPANVVIEQWNVLEFVRIEWDFQPSGVKLAGIEPAGVVIVRGRFVFSVIPRRLLIERSGIVADIEIVNGNELPSRDRPKRSDA